MGLFSAFGDGLKGLFGEGFADRAARAIALGNGDARAAAAITDGMSRRHEAELKATQSAAARDRLVQGLRAKGLNDDDISIIMANPEKFSEDFSSRYQTRTIDEGSTVQTPNLDGSALTYTSPKSFKEGADVMQTAPIYGYHPALPSNVPMLSRQHGNQASGQSPESANLNSFNSGPPSGQFGALRTEAEQYADSLADRGSKDWGNAVRDYTLKAHGPSARAMLGDRLAGQEEIARLRDGTAKRGQDLTDRRARDNATGHGRAVRSPNLKPAAPVKVQSLEQARKLPLGTMFQTPDGRIKVR